MFTYPSTSSGAAALDNPQASCVEYRSVESRRRQPGLERLLRRAKYWRIPNDRAHRVIDRDKKCVYCGVKMSLRKERLPQKATWEHIDNNDKNVSENNIALCCLGCNSSKGKKKLWDWFKEKGISTKAVAGIVRNYVQKHASKF